MDVQNPRASNIPDARVVGVGANLLDDANPCAEVEGLPLRGDNGGFQGKAFTSKKKAYTRFS